jgi:hypothetical protein
MPTQEMFANIKLSLRKMDGMMPWMLDKEDSRYSQTGIDHIYNEYKRIKSEAVILLARQDLTESERGNYETLLRDLDEHIAILEPFVSNGLTGGKRRNKRSYKKSRRCSKKTMRCGKKRTSRRK